VETLHDAGTNGDPHLQDVEVDTTMISGGGTLSSINAEFESGLGFLTYIQAEDAT
jgi:hypothetical protein